MRKVSYLMACWVIIIFTKVVLSPSIWSAVNAALLRGRAARAVWGFSVQPPAPRARSCPAGERKRMSKAATCCEECDSKPDSVETGEQTLAHFLSRLFVVKKPWSRSRSGHRSKLLSGWKVSLGALLFNGNLPGFFDRKQQSFNDITARS